MKKPVSPATIGAVVREARTAAGMSQSELGSRIGASRFWVAQFEKGKPGAELGLALLALQAVGLVVTVEPPATPAESGGAGTRVALRGVARATSSRAFGQATAPIPVVDLGWIIAEATVAPSAKSRKVWPTNVSKRPSSRRS